MPVKKAQTFVFVGFQAEPAEKRVRFDYAIELPDQTREEYSELLEVPSSTVEEWQRLPPPLLNNLCEQLHIALGASYWKMYCPPAIRLESIRLSPAQATFWNTVYTKGLGEFFYNNQIDFRGLVQFPVSDTASSVATTVPQSSTILLPLGGGKDSSVSAEMLLEHGHNFELFSLSTSDVQKNITRILNKPEHIIRRTLDAQMVARSKTDETYNGHVPITTIYTFSSLLVAALKGHGYIAFSNEGSANVGNLNYLGQDINHQWSKSAEAEQMFQEHIRTSVTDTIVPFSLLRPLTELEIIRRFCAYPKYFQAFSSCNRNFTISKEGIAPREGHAYWCGTCPKCAFVFCGLAAFLPKETCVDILGKNLYADEALLPLFQELLGVKDFKPFECVGTAEETRVAFAKAAAKGEYKGDVVMAFFESDVTPLITDLPAMEQEVFSIKDTSLIPEPFKPIYASQ